MKEAGGRALIIREPPDAERKGVDSEEFSTTAIALFNVKDTPNFQGTLAGIVSRYAVLSFNKTYRDSDRCFPLQIILKIS